MKKFVFLSIVILLLAACSTAEKTPIVEPTNTPIPPTRTSTPVPPTPTETITPTPTDTPAPTEKSQPTHTLEPIFSNQSTISLAEECRSAIDGFYTLRKDLGLPSHFMEEDPFRKETDFNPNQYLDVLPNLEITPGFILDYVYFYDWLGGKPLIYARNFDAEPFRTYEDFLGSYGEERTDESSYSYLPYWYEFLGQIKIDKTPASYFQHLILALLGDQFYLDWHALYNDTIVLCDPSDMAYVEEEMAAFDLEFPEDVQNRIGDLNFNPVILVEENSVTLRFLSFSKWSGFYERVYIVDKDDPMNIMDAQFNQLIEYDCGIMF